MATEGEPRLNLAVCRSEPKGWRFSKDLVIKRLKLFYQACDWQHGCSEKAEKLMDTINVLIAGSDRRINYLVQSIVLDVCYNQAAVNCCHTSRVDELQTRAVREDFGCIVINTAQLVPEPSRRAGRVSCEETLSAIRFIKRARPVPLLALGSAPDEEALFLEAGADFVAGRSWERETLQFEIRRLLRMPVWTEPVELTGRGSVLATFLGRGLNFLKNARGGGVRLPQ